MRSASAWRQRLRAGAAGCAGARAPTLLERGGEAGCVTAGVAAAAGCAASERSAITTFDGGLTSAGWCPAQRPGSGVDRRRRAPLHCAAALQRFGEDLVHAAVGASLDRRGRRAAVDQCRDLRSRRCFCFSATSAAISSRHFVDRALARAALKFSGASEPFGLIGVEHVALFADVDLRLDAA